MNIEVMTGLTRPQVDALISEVALEVPMLSPTKPYRPGLADSVVIVLILLRKNWTQDEAAAVWDCSQPTVSRRWELLRGPIAAALASFVLGGGMLGLASAYGNGMHAGKGREMVIGGGIGACVIGVAATAINLFHGAFTG